MTETWRRTHDWGLLNRAEIRAARDSGALPVLTLGSVEQHADHLPVDTDTSSCYRVALAAAERCPDPHVLVLPPPSFGVSPHHLDWPGTISLSLSTFIAVVTDVCESLHRTGFRRMLMINGHGGNRGPLTSACAQLACRGIEVGWVQYFGPGTKDWMKQLPGSYSPVGHACAFETAIQMALRPDEVQRIAGRIDGVPLRKTRPWSDDPLAGPLAEAGLTWAALFVGGDVGYLGDPAAATLEAGQAMLESCVAALALFYRDYAAVKLRAGMPVC